MDLTTHHTRMITRSQQQFDEKRAYSQATWSTSAAFKALHLLVGLLMFRVKAMFLDEHTYSEAYLYKLRVLIAYKLGLIIYIHKVLA